MRSTVQAFSSKDHLGSVHALIDEQGQVVAYFTYDAWGVPQNSSFIIHHSSFQLRYLFQGREGSYATGLYNFRARWYDPISGRWLSNDPIGISGGLNLYEFCGSNPVNYVDPWGEDTIRQNRKLNPKKLKIGVPVKHEFSHTFIFTTNEDGSLKSTYSWGNEFDSNNLSLLYKDCPEDRSAAHEAIEQKRIYEAAPWWQKPFLPNKFGKVIGDSTLDKTIEKAYQKKISDPNDPSRHRWFLWNNCKHEANRLIQEAQDGNK